MDKQKNNKQARKFKILAKNTNHNTQKDLQDDGSLIITGLASTTNKDLQHDIIEPTAIESMKTQAVGLNLCMDHNVYKTDEIIGAIIEVGESNENELWIKARIRPKYAGEVKEMLDTGINLGFSISGDVTDYSESESDLGWTIRDITLYEISLTGMPANWDTFGTVTTSKGLVESTCVTGACYEILKQEKDKFNDNEIMKVDKNIKTVVKDETTVTDEAKETITRQEAVDLFNELSAENNEQIKADIIEELKPELEKLIEEKLGQQEASNEEDKKDESFNKEEDEDEVKSQKEEKEDDKKEDESDESESEDDDVTESESESKDDEDEDEDKEKSTSNNEEDKKEDESENEYESKDEDEDEDKEKSKEASLNDVMDAIKTLITEIQTTKTDKSANDESQNNNSEEDGQIEEEVVKTTEEIKSDNDNEPVEKDMTETLVENATEQLLNNIMKHREVAPTQLPTEKDLKDNKESESEEGTLSFTKSLLDKI